MLRAPIKVALVGASAAALLGAAPGTDHSVRVHGSQLSNPGRTTHLSRNRVGPAKVGARASCEPGRKVTLMRLKSGVSKTKWKIGTPLGTPWKAKAEFDDVLLADGAALRLACPPGRSGVKRVSLPYTMYDGTVAESYGKLIRVSFDDGDSGWALASESKKL